MYQFSSVAQSWQTLCNPMDCSPPGLSVHHQLPEFTQTHQKKTMTDTFHRSSLPYESFHKTVLTHEFDSHTHKTESGPGEQWLFTDETACARKQEDSLTALRFPAQVGYSLTHWACEEKKREAWKRHASSYFRKQSQSSSVLASFSFQDARKNFWGVLL